MIRRLTLEEWFVMHQLDHIQRKHFLSPITMSVDLSRVVAEHRRRHGEAASVPYAAILIKAAAMTAEEFPAANRMVFRTFYGDRIVQFESVNVNVPLVMDIDGREHLNAISIPDANRRSLAEIRERIRQGRERDLRQLPIGRFFVRNRNTLLNRTLLRLLHFVVYNFPRLYVSKGGGGISVSSLLHHRAPGFDAVPYAFGATSFVLCASSVVEEEGRTLLRLGIGWDHYATSGNEMAAALRGLSAILGGEDPARLERLLR